MFCGVSYSKHALISKSDVNIVSVTPSKHEALHQCWLNVGPAYLTQSY